MIVKKHSIFFFFFGVRYNFLGVKRTNRRRWRIWRCHEGPRWALSPEDSQSPPRLTDHLRTGLTSSVSWSWGASILPAWCQGRDWKRFSLASWKMSNLLRSFSKFSSKSSPIWLRLEALKKFLWLRKMRRMSRTNHSTVYSFSASLSFIRSSHMASLKGSP